MSLRTVRDCRIRETIRENTAFCYVTTRKVSHSLRSVRCQEQKMKILETSGITSKTTCLYGLLYLRRVGIFGLTVYRSLPCRIIHYYSSYTITTERCVLARRYCQYWNRNHNSIIRLIRLHHELPL